MINNLPLLCLLKLCSSSTKFLQDHVTDEVIENAVTQLPDEVEGFSADELVRKLKNRRADLLF